MDKDIQQLLHKLNIQLRKNYATNLRKVDLHIGQDTALAHLWEEDGISQTKLTEKVGCKASTMSNMLNYLEKKEFIKRSRDPFDKRMSLVYLTEKGKGLEKLVKNIWKKEREKMLAHLLAEEKMLLRRLLQQMLLNIEDN